MSLLFDPWLNGSKLVNRLGLNRMATLRGEVLKVSSIIRDGNWNACIFGHTREFREEIESIQIFPGAADFLTWDLNSNNIFLQKLLESFKEKISNSVLVRNSVG